jgi:predicted O-methyltransferase YrrM
MAPVEWEIVLAVVEAVRPSRVLEWGSGGSTIELLREFPCIDRLVSIEHDPHWHRRVQRTVDTHWPHWLPTGDGRVDLRLVAPNEPLLEGATTAQELTWLRRSEREAGMFADYVRAGAPAVDVGSEPAPYDFVLVDGRARSFCLERAAEWLTMRGVLVLHDAQRTGYQRALEYWPGPVRLVKAWSQGQVAVCRLGDR